MYVSPEQATGAQVTDASDIYSLGVVAYECLAGHPPFTASEPLAIAFAHKHEPVPALPPDVPQAVSDLVYHMLGKTPQERPASVRAVADRADMLRGALALGEPPRYPGKTRVDLPAAPMGALVGVQEPGGGRPPGTGSHRSRRSRQLAAAGSVAVLCAAAAAVGLYLSGHISGRTGGDPGSNTAQPLSSPTHTRSASLSPTPTPTPTPSPSLVRILPPTPTPIPTSPSTADSPRPSKSVKPTPSRTTSPKASPSASASTSPSPTSSPTSTGPTTSPSPSSSPPSTSLRH